MVATARERCREMGRSLMKNGGDRVGGCRGEEEERADGEQGGAEHVELERRLRTAVVLVG